MQSEWKLSWPEGRHIQSLCQIWFTPPGSEGSKTRKWLLRSLQGSNQKFQPAACAVMWYFKEYTSHLHPENDFLWQTFNDKSTTNVWYTSCCVRVHTQKKNHAWPWWEMQPVMSTWELQYMSHSGTILNRGGFFMKHHEYHEYHRV